MSTLWADGLRKAATGETTIENCIASSSASCDPGRAACRHTRSASSFLDQATKHGQIAVGVTERASSE